MYYVYNGFYVFDFIAHCWATFSALRALLSSHIMTNKDDDDVYKLISLNGKNYLVPVVKWTLGERFKELRFANSS